MSVHYTPRFDGILADTATPGRDPFTGQSVPGTETDDEVAESFGDPMNRFPATLALGYETREERNARVYAGSDEDDWTTGDDTSEEDPSHSTCDGAHLDHLEGEDWIEARYRGDYPELWDEYSGVTAPEPIAVRAEVDSTSNSCQHGLVGSSKLRTIALMSDPTYGDPARQPCRKGRKHPRSRDQIWIRQQRRARNVSAHH